MGIYDTYGQSQLKVGDVCCHSFKIGDKVRIPDGAYIGYESVVIILRGIFVAEFNNLITKWGDRIDPEEILSGKSEIEKVLNEQIRKQSNEREIEEPKK